MKVLVSCEYSGRVRDAFIAKGHTALSCDLLPSESDKGPHYQGSIIDLLASGERWDLLIAHPPCTYLAASGARWWAQRQEEQKQAIEFFKMLLNLPIEKIAIENPVGILSSAVRKPDQIIHPWQFGHGETKKTCLWLKGLPLLKPENIVEGREDKIHKMPPSKDRWKNRSRTYQGIADAMANQWGNIFSTKY